jgi:hypothetical protein
MLKPLRITHVMLGAVAQAFDLFGVSSRTTLGGRTHDQAAIGKRLAFGHH